MVKQLREINDTIMKIRKQIENIFKQYPDIKLDEFKFLISDLEILFAQQGLDIPKGWRKGQFIFNFLEFLRTKGLSTNQSYRLADTFHLGDGEWDKYLEEFCSQK